MTTFVVKNENKSYGGAIQVFKKDIDTEFQQYQWVSLGQYDFEQFLWVRNQLIAAADNFKKEGNLNFIIVVGLS